MEYRAGIYKKPGSMNRAYCVFNFSVLFSLDPLFFVLNFSFD
jgi:hypothetical protein